MIHTFVIGMERCGTHSIANIFKKSCLFPSYVEHEPSPYLCQEASLVMTRKQWLTDNLKNRVKKYREMSGYLEFICEANHRLGFFAKYIGEQFPDAKFILMVRNPIKTLVSRVATLAHWPEIIERYPFFYQEKIKKLVPKGKDCFNTFRPKPPNFNTPLYEIYLWEWIETYRIIREQITGLKHVMILDTKDIAISVDALLDFTGRSVFNPIVAAHESKKRIDSVYDQEDKADATEYAWDMFEPHKKNINERILSEFPDDKIIQRIMVK